MNYLRPEADWKQLLSDVLFILAGQKIAKYLSAFWKIYPDTKAVTETAKSRRFLPRIIWNDATEECHHVVNVPAEHLSNFHLKEA